MASAIFAIGIVPASAEVTTFEDDFSDPARTEQEWVQGADFFTGEVGVDDAIWEATGGVDGVYRADTSTPPVWPFFSATTPNRLGCSAIREGDFTGIPLYRRSNDTLLRYRMRFTQPPPLDPTGSHFADGAILADPTHPSLFPAVVTGLTRLDGDFPNFFYIALVRGSRVRQSILDGITIAFAVLPQDFDFTEWNTVEASLNGATVTSTLTSPDGTTYTISGVIPLAESPDGPSVIILQGTPALGLGPAARIVEFDDFFFRGDELCIDNTPAGIDVEAPLLQNITITFEEVTTEGATSMTRAVDPPPDAPTSSSFSFLGEFYDITTTADFTGNFTLRIPYDDTGMTPEEEAALAVLHFNETTMEWEDATIIVNTIINVILARGDSLSVFVVAAPTRQITFLKPIGDGTVVELPAGPYKLGRTIPVKFRVLDEVGQIISNEDALALNATIRVFAVAVGGEGVPVDPGDNPPDLGDSFRYDADDFQFIFNLGTKNAGWTPDTIYRLEVLLDGIKSGEAFFALR